ncbi:MAG: hypothetical protein JWP29_1090 [Rhodoferax sp.]|nr:hypothetical protein [Rhodoferax sp.]
MPPVFVVVLNVLRELLRVETKRQAEIGSDKNVEQRADDHQPESNA